MINNRFYCSKKVNGKLEDKTIETIQNKTERLKEEKIH